MTILRLFYAYSFLQLIEKVTGSHYKMSPLENKIPDIWLDLTYSVFSTPQ